LPAYIYGHFAFSVTLDTLHVDSFAPPTVAYGRSYFAGLPVPVAAPAATASVSPTPTPSATATGSHSGNASSPQPAESDSWWPAAYTTGMSASQLAVMLPPFHVRCERPVVIATGMAIVMPTSALVFFHCCKCHSQCFSPGYIFAVFVYSSFCLSACEGKREKIPSQAKSRSTPGRPPRRRSISKCLARSSFNMYTRTIVTSTLMDR
jgi:hypothetical protein